MIFPETVLFRPQNSKICDWMGFPDIRLAHGPILNKTEQVLITFAWMFFFQKSVEPMPRKFANKG